MAKDFKGHFEPDDPRGPLSGAGGCTWPTVPPWRMRLYAPDPPGLWAWLKSTGLLYEQSGGDGHDSTVWTAISALPFYLTSAWAWRNWIPATQTLQWWLFFNSPFVGPVIEVLNESTGIKPGNVDVEIDNSDWDWPPLASPGDELTLYQVYFNETDPPQGWPPV